MTDVIKSTWSRIDVLVIDEIQSLGPVVGGRARCSMWTNRPETVDSRHGDANECCVMRPTAGAISCTNTASTRGQRPFHSPLMSYKRVPMSDAVRPTLFPVEAGDEIELRSRCTCGSTRGRVLWDRSGQDVVRCSACDEFAYNAPRVETGRPRRSVRTRPDISPGQRARILERAGGACELCHHRDRPLHVGHLLSVEDGLVLAVPKWLLRDDENLAAICAEENLGQGRRSAKVLLLAALLRARELRAIGRDAA